MEQEVRVAPAGLPGTLALPQEFQAVVLFAHGSGSGRGSPRNRHVAAALREAGFGTLLFDMLTPEEAADRTNLFDTHLLAERVLMATRWLADHPAVGDRPIGYFGAASGSAAVLVAAARAAEHQRVQAVVSRGGRPDLAEVWLDGVAAPTLLIVGSDDHPALALNQQAMNALHCVKALDIVPGAGHLFEEPGALDAVAESAATWFTTHLKP